MQLFWALKSVVIAVLNKDGGGLGGTNAMLALHGKHSYLSPNLSSHW